MDRDSFFKLASLAKIQCSLKEQEAFFCDLEAMFLCFESLKDVDTENIAPCYSPQPDKDNSFREDVVEMTMDPKDFLKNTISKDGMVKIPVLLKP